jgi:hypothetical protein
VPASAITGSAHADDHFASLTGELVAAPSDPVRQKSTTEGEIKFTAATIFESILENVPGSEASGLASLLVEAAAKSQPRTGQHHRPRSIVARGR